LNGKKYILPALCAFLLVASCGAYHKTIEKDLPIEEMDRLNEKYVGRTAWTRALIVDVKQNGIIDRGTKVEIVELDLHWGTAVGVRAPNNRKYRHVLNLERPVTAEAFEQMMDKLFWYEKPDKRYRMNLREYGKRTARAIRDSELFKGMKREAAIESWGWPDEMLSNDIGNVLSEQWIYKDPRQRTKKKYIWLIDGLVDKWEE
jgi:hypothetical protein